MAEGIVDLDPFVEMLGRWHGLASTPDRALVEDSLVLLPFLAGARSVVDVGAGGGLPGIPMKLARPDLELTMIEANHRKAAFLVQACSALHLDGVSVLAERAEDAGRQPALREHFDAAVARALARMSVLAELCLPLVRVGGRLLAMKVDAEAELGEAQQALEVLGGRVVEVAATPSAARAKGQVVVIEKFSPTPELYPRRAGLPARRPL